MLSQMILRTSLNLNIANEAVVETDALTGGEAQPAEASRVRGTEVVGEVQLKIPSCVRGTESSDVAGEDTYDISVNEETELLIVRNAQVTLVCSTKNTNLRPS